METVFITIALVPQWYIYAGPVPDVMCGEHTLCTMDLGESGVPGLTSAVSMWAQWAEADLSFPYAWLLFTARQPLLCFPKVHLSFAFILSPPFLTLPGLRAVDSRADSAAGQATETGSS